MKLYVGWMRGTLVCDRFLSPTRVDRELSHTSVHPKLRNINPLMSHTLKYPGT